MSGRRGRKWLVLGTLAVLAAVGGLVAYNTFFREEPPPYFESDEAHFMWGSIGTESAEGIPYWIWLVLPRIFPEYLPGTGGWASLGIHSAPEQEMPIGLSKATIGFPRVAINCAMCHITSVRTTPGGPVTLVAGGTSNRTSPQQYLRFLLDCASDPRFTADVILAEIAKNHELSAFERLIYRFVIIPQTREALLEVKARESWMDENPDWGRGRIDPFNPVKFRYLGQPKDGTIGNSDMMPLWNLGTRTGPGRAFHWDGLNTDLREVVISSAIGDGTPVSWVDRDVAKWNNTDRREQSSLRRIQDYIARLQPPQYPLAIDAALAAKGEPVYRAQCADCHAPDGKRTGTVIPVEEVGTDRHRLDMWTKGSADAYNAHTDGYDWKMSNFQKTNGYLSPPMDGLWLRGPYLHNGSVPTLADLLEPVEKRPTLFWRGYDLLDAGRVGFVSVGPEAEASGSRHDVTEPGNGNAGHTYGSTLSAEEKRALLEYLKTL
jgi:hypothetical protein